MGGGRGGDIESSSHMMEHGDDEEMEEGEDEDRDEDVNSDGDDDDDDDEDDDDDDDDDEDADGDGDDGKDENKGDEEEIEVEVQHGPHENKGDEQEIEVQRGPPKPRLIGSFSSHRAANLWVGKETGLLKIISGSSRLTPWDMEQDCADHQHFSWKGRVEASGLAHLGTCMIPHLNTPLITAFVERWHPETCSFHLPFGEMTITLMDVAHILILDVYGKPLLSTVRDMEDLRPKLANRLEVTVDALNGEIKQGGLHLNGLRDNPSDRALCYLLRLLGSTVFVDKSGSRVKHLLAEFLRGDSGKVEDYAWGSVVLCNTYFQLSMASRADAKQLGGCNTLIEAWIYEHFPEFRPSENRAWNFGKPRAMKWVDPNRQPVKSVDMLRHYRNILDCMEGRSVDWNPYASTIDQHSLFLFSGIIHYCQTTQPHMPDRVMRQFGYTQRIPCDPIAPLEAKWHKNVMSCKVFYEPQLAYWNSWQNRLVSLSEYTKAVLPWEAQGGYDDWFAVHGHPCVLPSSEPLPRRPYTDHELIQLARGFFAPIVERGDSMSKAEIITRVRKADHILGGPQHPQATRESSQSSDTSTRTPTQDTAACGRKSFGSRLKTVFGRKSGR